MEISDLELQNFRSYPKQRFQFSPNTTLIIGPNTSGKTNLIEAIYLLAHGQSWRPGLDQDLISWGQEVGRVKGQISNQVKELKDLKENDESKSLAVDEKQQVTNLEVVLTRGEIQGKKVAPKRYLVNGVGKRRQDFLDHFFAVLFSPEDLMLILNSPSTRRHYLDSVLEGIDRVYRQRKVEYEKALRNRNYLLDKIREGKAKSSELEFWNEVLVRAGQYLTQKRAEFIEFINTQADSTNGQNQLKYLVSNLDFVRLANYQQREVFAGATLIGPHRDDFRFEICDTKYDIRDLAIYGSRGQQRTAVFWLKLGELAYVTNVLEHRPVLLLDDLFSELDADHRRHLWQIIPHHQTIMTTTDSHLVEETFLKEIRVIELQTISTRA